MLLTVLVHPANQADSQVAPFVLKALRGNMPRLKRIYADIDIWPQKSPQQFSEDTILDTDEFFSATDAWGRPSQWFFASEPGHPILYFTMVKILSNILDLPDITKLKPVFCDGSGRPKVGLSNGVEQ